MGVRASWLQKKIKKLYTGYGEWALTSKVWSINWLWMSACKCCNEHPKLLLFKSYEYLLQKMLVYTTNQRLQSSSINLHKYTFTHLCVCKTICMGYHKRPIKSWNSFKSLWCVLVLMTLISLDIVTKIKSQVSSQDVHNPCRPPRNTIHLKVFKPHLRSIARLALWNTSLDLYIFLFSHRSWTSHQGDLCGGAVHG